MIKQQNGKEKISIYYFSSFDECLKLKPNYLNAWGWKGKIFTDLK